MSDEKTENRIKVENLPETEKELSTEEAKEVKGGAKGSGKGQRDWEPGDLSQ